ncbi:hypothetical protein BCR35DRAFT_303606 [Leucosporidium creatinivorum]|uniref:Uncharacterized protein n=1 Tax=Leucosporidium creatinivorum TaxID=106004 RepID=A0A1Y2FG69_9BASI|nr:hypothetical protein BCR35DRAFT_303606 [Leucosporidium creatinivorum]
MSSPTNDAALDPTRNLSETTLQDQPLPAERRRSSRASSAVASASLASTFQNPLPAASAPKSTPRGGARKLAGRGATRPNARKGKQTFAGGPSQTPELDSTATGSSTGDDYVPVASGSGSKRTGGATGRGGMQDDFHAAPELPPVPEGEELDMLRQAAIAALAAQATGLEGARQTEPDAEAPPLMSATARGKRRAETAGDGEGNSREGKAPARRSRSVSVAGSASVDGGEESVKLKVKREKKPLKKVTKKSVRRPELPALFKIDNPNEEVLQEREKELQRAMDPELAKKVGASLAKQSDIYKKAYAALEQELIRVQIEESVLRNVKKVVRDERDKLRYARGAG